MPEGVANMGGMGVIALAEKARISQRVKTQELASCLQEGMHSREKSRAVDIVVSDP